MTLLGSQEEKRLFLFACMLFTLSPSSAHIHFTISIWTIDFLFSNKLNALKIQKFNFYRANQCTKFPSMRGLREESIVLSLTLSFLYRFNLIYFHTVTKLNLSEPLHIFPNISKLLKSIVSTLSFLKYINSNLRLNFNFTLNYVTWQ